MHPYVIEPCLFLTGHLVALAVARNREHPTLKLLTLCMQGFFASYPRCSFLVLTSWAYFTKMPGKALNGDDIHDSSFGDIYAFRHLATAGQFGRVVKAAPC